MKPILLLTAVLLLISQPASGQLYEWTDENGSVNFTDNPDSVPAKYRNRVRTRESVDNEAPKAVEKPAAQTPVQTAPRPSPRVELYDGHPLSWWQSKYSVLSAKVVAVQGELAKLKGEEDIARRKKRVLQRGVDRRAFAVKAQEVAAKEAEVTAAEKDLAAFTSQAETAGLSVDMLESGSR